MFPQMCSPCTWDMLDIGWTSAWKLLQHSYSDTEWAASPHRAHAGEGLGYCGNSVSH